MKNLAFASTIVAMSLLFASAAYAQSSINPTIVLSSNEVSFFNGDQGSVHATIKNNDLQVHTLTVSVFPPSLDKVSAFPSLNHVTLAPGESRTIEVFFSSLFEAEFVPREFVVTVSDTEDNSIAASKEVFVRIQRRSPVFVLSLGTNKFSYLPGETINITSIISNNGGDNFDDYTMQASIVKDGEILKRFESVISFLPERSNNAFANIYTFGQFAEPGLYSVQVTLTDPKGNLVNTKSINFKLGDVDKTSQSEKSTFGIFESATTITAVNQGNSPSDITVTAEIPGYSKEFFASDIEPESMQQIGSSIRVTWVLQDVGPGENAQVVYRFVIWKIWVTILFIIAVIWLAFKYVFTVRIMKRSSFSGSVKKEAEIPVSIEVVNRSLHEVRDVVVKDFVPPIARIVPRFETVKPTIHETGRATELTWRFDSLHPGEERVFAYRIKSKMDVLGNLRLNPATISYSTKKREKRSAASGGVSV